MLGLNHAQDPPQQGAAAARPRPPIMGYNLVVRIPAGLPRTYPASHRMHETRTVHMVFPGVPASLGSRDLIRSLDDIAGRAGTLVHRFVHEGPVGPVIQYGYDDPAEAHRVVEEIRAFDPGLAPTVQPVDLAPGHVSLVDPAARADGADAEWPALPPFPRRE